jgi:hypothetical protein
LDRDDARWRQWAKEAWLKNEDQNTKYYHACANAKRRKNFIYAIKDLEGQQWETTETIGMAFVDYFIELFIAGLWTNLETCVRHIARGVIEEMNAELTKIFTKEEIGVAITQMAALKALGPDGYTA